MEIKYRAWYKPDKECNNGLPKFVMRVITGDCVNFIMEDDSEYAYDFEVPFLDDDWIIEQFIGKQDITGIDMYEGDIIEYQERLDDHGDRWTLTGYIVYDPDYCAYGIANKINGDAWNYFTDMTISHFRIIGNIFQTPELLKQ